MTDEITPSADVNVETANKLLIGYYYAGDKYDPTFSQGNLRTAAAYTNTYLSWARMAYSNYGNEPNSVWRQLQRKYLKAADSLGMKIYLQLNMQDPQDTNPAMIDIVLESATPYWDRVVAIELADEPNWDRQATKGFLKQITAQIARKNLAPKPLGITYFTDKGLAATQEWRDIVTLPMDFTGLECYLPLPYAVGAVGTMKANVRAHRGCLPDDRKVWLTMMGYTRNEVLTVDQAIPAQQACYDLARESNRTVGMTIFSFCRPSGTLSHKRLQAEHIRIVADMKARGIFA
jgi:hypothetical protein